MFAGAAVYPPGWTNWPSSAAPYGGAAATYWPTSTTRLQRPPEAINGRLEALRRNALGFRNLTHYDSAHFCTAATSPTHRRTLNLNSEESPVSLRVTPRGRENGVGLPADADIRLGA